MERGDKEPYGEYFRNNPFGIARGFSQYNKSKMKETFKDCNPTICDKDLMSDEGEYRTIDIIKEQCDCAKKSICIRVIELLKKNNIKDALELL